MPNIYEFYHQQKTWGRPNHISPISVASKTIMPSLTADFEMKIQNQFHLTKYKKRMESRFPLTDKVTVKAIIESRQSHNLPFVSKVIIDALAGPNLAYIDDSKVFSIYVEQHLKTSEKVDITLYHEACSHQSMLAYPFIGFSVDATPNGDIIQYPRTPEHSLIQNPDNTSNINLIRQKLTQQNLKLLSSGDLSVNIEIHTDSNGDLDNFALLYLIAMEGLIYPNIKDIKEMHLNLYRGSTKGEYARIEVMDRT